MPNQQRYWDGVQWTDNIAPQYRFGPPPPVTPPITPAYATAATPSLLGPGGVPYASFLRRFSGLVIDGLIFVPFALIIGVIFAVPLFTKISNCLELTSQSEMERCITSLTDQVVADTGFITAASILIGLVQVAYFTICLRVWGRSIGGLAVGIRCVTASGTNPSWSKSFVRALIPFGFSLLGLIPLIGVFAFVAQVLAYVSMLWSPKRQTWMDRAAGTFVIKPVK
jgi:uncharacterized RDD family membrane protein YckC